MKIEGDKEKKEIRFIIVPMFVIEDKTLLDGEKMLFVRFIKFFGKRLLLVFK